jgi:hypothetical protein
MRLEFSEAVGVAAIVERKCGDHQLAGFDFGAELDARVIGSAAEVCSELGEQASGPRPLCPFPAPTRLEVAGERGAFAQARWPHREQGITLLRV